MSEPNEKIDEAIDWFNPRQWLSRLGDVEMGKILAKEIVRLRSDKEEAVRQTKHTSALTFANEIADFRVEKEKAVKQAEQRGIQKAFKESLRITRKSRSGRAEEPWQIWDIISEIEKAADKVAR